MYYSDFVINGEYLCHHGVKGMHWGVRRFQDSQVFKKNRIAYKNKIDSDFKSSTNKAETYKSARRDIFTDHLKSYAKHYVGSIAASTALGIGSGIALALGGPAAYGGVRIATFAAGAALSAISTGQQATRIINTAVRMRSLSDTYREHQSN